LVELTHFFAPVVHTHWQPPFTQVWLEQAVWFCHAPVPSQRRGWVELVQSRSVGVHTVQLPGPQHSVLGGHDTDPPHVPPVMHDW